MAAPTTAANDVPQQVDVSMGMVLQRLDGWLDGAVRLLPNIAVAIVTVLLFYALALLIRWLVVGSATRRERKNLGVVLGGFIKWAMVLLGFLLAATIVFPSLHPGDLIAGLGVSSIAVGFAFKDILQNWLAGLLILLRQPFQIRDQIEVNGYEGTVERIETRATIIRTYDGQRAVIPNSDIYTNAVLVNTAHDKRRSQYDIGIGYGDGIDQACEVIRVALAGVAEVETDPAPEALPWDLAANWATIRVRWWTHSRRADVVLVHARVMQAIKEGLDEAHIDMPYDTQVQLFHDKTEIYGDDRGRQRGGWPNSVDGASSPRWRAEATQRSKKTPDERS